MSDCRVLVVDDNHDVANSLVALLGIYGVSAIAAYGGREAVDRCGELHPSLVFLDLDMPDRDGFETIADLRRGEGDEHISIVALTARSGAADKRRCREAGFDRHVCKPINPDELVEIVANACTQH